MKITAVCSILALTALFVFGPSFSLEAKHHRHVSVNFGPVFSAPAPTYVVQRYQSYPPMAQERIYVDQFGRPYRSETIYTQPYVEEVYMYPSRPAVFTGFSFGLNFGR